MRLRGAFAGEVASSRWINSLMISFAGQVLLLAKGQFTAVGECEVVRSIGEARG